MTPEEEAYEEALRRIREALRNDPTLLDEVGLVVLDEGHYAWSRRTRDSLRSPY
jgi:hypothetical protein